MQSTVREIALRRTVLPFPRACFPQENHIVSVPFETIEKMLFLKICFVSPEHLGTIQNLIPGWTTFVKLLKQVKNWQSPSRDLWSNCLTNSREDDKGQTKYSSGRQKDNSKTICGRGGYVTLRTEALWQPSKNTRHRRHWFCAVSPS